MTIPFSERVTCTIPQAVEASGVGRSSLYLEMDAGRLEYVKVGSRRLIVVASLLKLLTPSTKAPGQQDDDQAEVAA
jgi:hypothetical protein